jgi:drug/metabolite transporter (DMT)-like permease
MAAERSSSTSANPHAVVPGPKYLTLICFGIIYFVWGSTFLAIRVGVREVPPLVLAAMRFFAAGAFLVAWMRMRGEKFPTAREWRSASLLGIVIFLFDYGLLFWSERRVPSGIAAVMLGTIPVFMALAEIIFLGTQKLTLALAIGLLTGLCGVAVLMSPALHLGGAPVDKLGAAALLFASVSWSVASVIARKAPLPESKVMSSGAQMLTGGIFLAMAAAVAGEFHGFDVTSVSRGAWLALLYLIVAGSIIGFTAYVWLLHHESPTKVGTYAYVNPIVAVIVGYFFGGEALTMRTIVGSACVLLSVILITVAASRKKPASAAASSRETAPAIADAD